MQTRKPTHHRPLVPPLGPGLQLACQSQILSVRAVFAVAWIAVKARLELQMDLLLEHGVAALRTLIAAEIVAAGTTKVEESWIVEESQR
jgi:hypothetical protein